MQPAESLSLYDRLEALPEGLTGEILNGQLHTQPRPAVRMLGPNLCFRSRSAGHSTAEEGAPAAGGSWLSQRSISCAIPRSVFRTWPGGGESACQSIPRDQRFETVPDWVCEVLSPSTESKDRRVKMPIYARYGVGFVWLVDPLSQMLEAYVLEEGDWKLLGTCGGEERVAVPPFEAVPIDLGGLWT